MFLNIASKMARLSLSGFGFQSHFHAPGLQALRMREATSFKSFCANPKSASIEIEQLDPVAGAIDEDEYCPGDRILLELLAHEGTERIEALAQIAGRGRQTDFDAVREDHIPERGEFSATVS